MGVKVSVIVSVHNPGDSADPCIRSTLEQTLPADEYEVIFVDDGSTDGQAHGIRSVWVAERLDRRDGALLLNESGEHQSKSSLCMRPGVPMIRMSGPMRARSWISMGRISASVVASPSSAARPDPSIAGAM